MRGSPGRFADGSAPAEPRSRSFGFAVNGKTIALVVAILAVVIVGVSALLPSPDEPTLAVPSAAPTDDQPEPTADPTNDPTREPTGTGSGTTDPEHNDGSDDHTDEPPPAAAATAAAEFVDAWLLVGTPDQRRDAMTPYATADLVRSVQNADPNRIPNAKREGKPRPTESGEFQAAYRITLSNDDEVEVVVVVDGSGEWRASTIDPVTAG